MFSVNQVRQLYVVNSKVDAVTDASATGSIAVKTAGTGNDKEMYFVYKSAASVLRSDFINLKNLTRVEAIKASAMTTKMRKVEVSLNSSVNSGAPVVGQEYILGINFKNFFSSGDASQYYKDAAVHVTSAMTTAKALFDAMKAALDLAFSREDGATATSNPYLAFSVTGTGANAKLVIEEKEQDWILGTKKQRRILFDVFPSTVYVGGGDTVWGTVADVTPTTELNNGKKIADLEWFCAGERGDQFRGMGYPNVIHTEYLVDPTKEYSVIEIHFAFTDSGVNSYRTEKELTIAVPNGSTAAAKYTAINSIITAINTAAGTNVGTLIDQA